MTTCLLLILKILCTFTSICQLVADDQLSLFVEYMNFRHIQSNLNNTANSSGCTWIYSCDELCIIDIEV